MPASSRPVPTPGVTVGTAGASGRWYVVSFPGYAFAGPPGERDAET